MQQKGPWKIKETICKYKNPWVDVREHKVIRPDGKEGIYGVVDIIHGSQILPMDDQDNVYLTKEFRFAIGRESIEVPGGAIDEGENPLTAAKRELKEELGIEASEWVSLGNFDPFTSVVKCPAYLFVAKGLRFKSHNREGTELIETIKVPFSEAVKMVMEGKITHGATCFLILKASQLFKKNKF